MKKIGLTFALVAVLAVPAAAAAHDDSSEREDGERERAGRPCHVLRGTDGDILRRAFGRRTLRAARRRCRSERARLKGRLLVRAIRECRAERVQDPAAFEEKYAPIHATPGQISRDEAGEERGERGEAGEERGDDVERLLTAFVRCVRDKYGELRQEFSNAAQECKAERAEDRAAFRAKYGTNRNGRNALGKCVSRHVRGDEDDADEGERVGVPEAGDDDERGDAPRRRGARPDRPDDDRPGKGPREL